LSRRLGISVGTAVAAYEWLERQGTLEIRPRSGYYVAHREPDVREPRTVTRSRPPTRVALADLVLEIQANARDPGLFPFGEALVSPDLLPSTRLNRAVRRAASAFPGHAVRYEEPSGSFALRRQIARLGYRLSFGFKPDEVIVTSGAMEALSFAVRVVARAGDAVAVESPGCYEALRCLESLGVRALEIPVRPRQGPDCALLERGAREHRIKALLMSACCHSPLGCQVPDSVKAGIVALAARLEIPIIEDDAFGDLSFSPQRPKPLKAFDSTGSVLYCGADTHVVAPGFHLGWLHPGRFLADVRALKAITTIGSPAIPQLAFAEFLAAGAYERHLRRLIRVMAHSTRALAAAIAEYFPRDTRISHPEGGFYVWVELPGNRSGLRLYRAALQNGIAIVPGIVFSPHRQFRNCVRLSCGFPWSARAEGAVARLGSLVERLS
jgi:DNA-binding transcriptional MocR family regulator